MVGVQVVVPPLGTVAVLRSEAARLRSGSDGPPSSLPAPRALPSSARPVPPTSRPGGPQVVRPTGGVPADRPTPTEPSRLVPSPPGPSHLVASHLAPPPFGAPHLEPSAVGLLLTDAATVALGSVVTGQGALAAAEDEVAEGSAESDVATLRSAARVLTEQVARVPGEGRPAVRPDGTSAEDAPTEPDGPASDGSSTVDALAEPGRPASAGTTTEDALADPGSPASAGTSGEDALTEPDGPTSTGRDLDPGPDDVAASGSAASPARFVGLPAAAWTGWPGDLAGVLGQVWGGLSGRPGVVRDVQRSWEEVAAALEARAAGLPVGDGAGPDVRGALVEVLLAHAALCREVGATCVRVAAEVDATRARVAGWLGAPTPLPGPDVAATLLPGPVADALAERLEALADLLEDLVVAGTAELGRLDAAGLALSRAAALLRGSEDPGPPGTTAAGSPTATVAGPGPTALDHAVALVQRHWSAAASGSTAAPLPSGWRRVDPQEVGLDPALLADERSGFGAALFTGDAWVLSFAGTDFSGDLVADFLVEDLTGGLVLSPQVVDVLALVDAVHAGALRDRLVWSGHSLGGRLAAVAAMASGDTAVTFNAAGVSTATTGYVAARRGATAQQLLDLCLAGTVRAYRTEGDVVTSLQERPPTAPLLPDAPGRPLPLGSSVDGLVEGHLMPHVVAEWERAHGSLLGR